MSHKSLFTITILAPLLLSTAGFAQTSSSVDPACLIKNADGSQKVDMMKCPDGTKVGAAGDASKTNSNDATKKLDENATNSATTGKSMDATKPLDENATNSATTGKSMDATKPLDENATNSATTGKSKDATKKIDENATNSSTMGKTGVDATTTASTTPATNDMIVSPDKMTGAKILSANDFIGKSVYSKDNEKVGKVDDIILSETGVQAVVLGVGGFLGMGTKDVAVVLSSIEIAKDGNTTKLVMNTTKDQLKAAPTYDPKIRTYLN